MKTLIIGLILPLLLQLTPLEEAIELKEDFDMSKEEIVVAMLGEYRMSSIELTGILLDERLFPQLREQPMDLVTVLKNYGKYSFDRQRIRTALDHHYPGLSEDRRLQIMNEAYGTQGTPLTYWQGTYELRVKWWGSNFAPLEIRSDGRIILQGAEITSFIYDPKTLELTFARTLVGEGNPRAEFTFQEENGRKFFRGNIWPMPESGALAFNGDQAVLPTYFALQNMDSRYLGFKAGNSTEVWGTASRIGSYEKLELVKNDDGSYAIKNKDGHYLGFKSGHEPPIWGSSDRIGGYEKFTLIKNSDGTFAIRNKDGHYLGFKAGNNPPIWVASRIGGYEKLSFVETE